MEEKFIGRLPESCSKCDYKSVLQDDSRGPETDGEDCCTLTSRLVTIYYGRRAPDCPLKESACPVLWIGGFQDYCDMEACNYFGIHGEGCMYLEECNRCHNKFKSNQLRDSKYGLMCQSCYHAMFQPLTVSTDTDINSLRLMSGPGDSIISSQISFMSGDNEMLRLDSDTGNIYVNGKLIENDMDVVNGMRAFLASSEFHRCCKCHGPVEVPDFCNKCMEEAI